MCVGRSSPPEQGARARLFRPFEPLEAIPHKRAPGLGLGLALVSEIAGALGARGQVEAATPEGSVFVLQLAAEQKASR